MFKFLKNNNLKKAVVLDIPLYFENNLNKVISEKSEAKTKVLKKKQMT